MVHETYEVTYKPPKKNAKNPEDESFRSFICIFLVILAICAIILLVIWGLTRTKHHPDEDYDEDSSWADKVSRDEIFTSETKPTTKPTFKPHTTRRYKATTLIDKYTTVIDTTTTSKPFKKESLPVTEHDEDLYSKAKTTEVVTKSATDTEEFTDSLHKKHFERLKTSEADEIDRNRTSMVTTTEPIAIDVKTYYEDLLDVDNGTDYGSGDTTDEFIPVDFSTETGDELNVTDSTDDDILSTVTDISDPLLRGAILITTTLSTDSTDSYENITDSTDMTEDKSTTMKTTTESILIATDIDYVSHSTLSTDLTTTESDITDTTITSDKKIETTTEAMVAVIHKIESRETSDMLCETPVCRSTASNILGKIDFKTDHCDNFYEFVCGKKKNPVFKSRREMLQRRVWDRIIDQLRYKHPFTDHATDVFRNFFDKCVNFGDTLMMDTNKIREEVLSVDKFYDRSTDDIPDDRNTTELLVRLLERHSTPLFDVGLDVDSHADVFVFKMSLPSKTYLFDQRRAECEREMKSYLINTKSPYLNDAYNIFQGCLKNHTTYINNVEFVLHQLGIFDHLDEPLREKMIKDIRFVLDLDILNIYDEESSHAEIMNPLFHTSYKEFTIDDMKTKFPVIDWTHFFTRLAGQPVPESNQIQVYFSDFLEQLFLNITSMDLPVLHNTLLSIYAHDLYIELMTPHHYAKDRETYCVQLASTLMEDVATIQYLVSFEKTEMEYSINLMQGMFKNLSETLIRSVQSISFDNVDEIVNKIRGIGLNRYEADKVYEINKINERYKDIKNDDTTYIENLIDSVKGLRKFKYSVWNKKASSDIWNHLVSPIDVSIKSIYHLNKVVVPYGIFAESCNLYDQNYLLYAEIGFQLAKGIGRHFDLEGYNRNIKTIHVTSYDEYLENCESCIKNHMKSSKHITVNGHEASYKMNSRFAVNERISDDLAIRLTYDTIKDDEYNEFLPWVNETYTPQQIFYILLVQNFCSNDDLSDYVIDMFYNGVMPNRLRVDSFLNNDGATFGKLFECHPGTRMNQPYKCPQFPFEVVDDTTMMTDDDRKVTSS